VSDRLYLVHVDPGAAHEQAMEALDAIALAPGLLLARSAETRSRLYHRVKRATGTRALLVGRLAGHPKFMGMAPGSLAALRRWDDLAGGG
jgi:hypothetical protein